VEQAGAHRVPPSHAPNPALNLTVYSVRSCVAPASGSR
jgi:hypothetical protein